jgi:hypothetical protein
MFGFWEKRDDKKSPYSKPSESHRKESDRSERSDKPTRPSSKPHHIHNKKSEVTARRTNVHISESGKEIGKTTVIKKANNPSGFWTEKEEGNKSTLRLKKENFKTKEESKEDEPVDPKEISDNLDTLSLTVDKINDEVDGISKKLSSIDHIIVRLNVLEEQFQQHQKQYQKDNLELLAIINKLTLDRLYTSRSSSPIVDINPSLSPIVEINPSPSAIVDTTPIPISHTSPSPVSLSNSSSPPLSPLTQHLGTCISHEIISMIRDLQAIQHNEYINILETENSPRISEMMEDCSNCKIEEVENSKVSEVGEDSKISEVVDSPKVLEVVENSKVCEVVEDSKIFAVVEDSKVSEVVEDSKVSEVVEDSKVSDSLKVSEVVEDSKVSEVSDSLKVSEVVEDSKVPEMVKIIEDYKESEILPLPDIIQISSPSELSDVVKVTEFGQPLVLPFVSEPADVSSVLESSSEKNIVDNLVDTLITETPIGVPIGKNLSREVETKLPLLPSFKKLPQLIPLPPLSKK